MTSCALVADKTSKRGRRKRRRRRPDAAFGVAMDRAIAQAVDRGLVRNRTDFCRKVGIDGGQLYRYEQGDVSPRLEQLEEWAPPLGCTMTDLVRWTEEAAGKVREERDPPKYKVAWTDEGPVIQFPVTDIVRTLEESRSPKEAETLRKTATTVMEIHDSEDVENASDSVKEDT